MRYATFNVLADAYTGYGDYSHMDPELMKPGARTRGIVRLVSGLGADVVGLQEVEPHLLEAFDKTCDWQLYWSPKSHENKPDGCLTLVRRGIRVSEFDTISYPDNSGHIAQRLQIGRVAVANTHIKWAPADAPEHAGVAQASHLISQIDTQSPAILLGDLNDRPGGPVRELVASAGFTHLYGERPTATVDGIPAALDLLAIRGLTARCVTRNYDLSRIPDDECPSDHIPVVADVYPD